MSNELTDSLKVSVITVANNDNSKYAILLEIIVCETVRLHF